MTQTRMREVTFASDAVELAVLPDVGARWHRLAAFGHDLIRTPADLRQHIDDTFFWGAYPMAPWCGRIDAGSVVFAGRRVSFEPNFPDGTAIHGQVFARPWEADGASGFRIRGGGDSWPWPYEARFGIDVHDAEVRFE